MSLSKAAPKCGFCKVGKGIYSCPRCSQRYCSSYCYKCREHEVCSEAFYRQWVEQSLQEKASDRSDREQMLHILKKLADESVDDPFDNELDIEDRFAGVNINDADESVIWDRLSDGEKAEFKAYVESGKELEKIVSVKKPWWTVTTLNLVSEIDSSESDLNDAVAVRPPYPLNVKKLSDLTSSKPSECIQYNLINLLYSYAFLNRFYNSDLRDFLEDVVDAMFTLTPVLSENKNYLSLEESVQDSIRLIDNSELKIPMLFIKSIIDDVTKILHGPSNAKSSTFVVCALHDIKLLFLELKCTRCKKEDMDKKLKKRLLLSVKKVEYFMSWCLDFENTFRDLASGLLQIMLPDMISGSSKCEEDCSPKPKMKLFIEEI